MSAWVSVEERLPEIGIIVVAARSYSNDTVEFWIADMDEDGEWGDEGGEVIHPLYWMPLPAPPETP